MKMNRSSTINLIIADKDKSLASEENEKQGVGGTSAHPGLDSSIHSCQGVDST